VRRFVRVVHAVRSVPQREHQPREVADEADVPQHPLADVRHFLDGEPDLPAIRPRRWFETLQLQASSLRRAKHRAGPFAEARGQPREHDPAHEWDRRENAMLADKTAPTPNVRVPTCIQ